MGVLCSREENVDASVYYCRTCQEEFCRECAKSHEKLQRRHKVVGFNSEIMEQGKEHACNECGRSFLTRKGRLVFGRRDLHDGEEVARICSKHPGKAMEWLCVDHEVVACLDCIHTDHGACRNIKYFATNDPIKIAIDRMKAKPNKPDRSHQGPIYTIYNKVFDGYVNFSITGFSPVTFMPDETFVLIDTLKSLALVVGKPDQYRRAKHCLSLPNWPRDICTVSKVEVAVVVSDSKKRNEVHFLYVKDDELIPGKVVELQDVCHAICHKDGFLYICSKRCIYRYAIRGSIFETIRNDAVRNITSIGVSEDGKILYVSDYKRCKLITMDLEGNVISVLENIKKPSGIFTTKCGHVFVCSSATVLQIDKEGRYIISDLFKTGDDRLRNDEAKSITCIEKTTFLYVIVSEGSGSLKCLWLSE